MRVVRAVNAVFAVLATVSCTSTVEVPADTDGPSLGMGTSNTEVDALDSSDSGPICGNGVIESGEDCDDGNDDNLDDCTNECFLPSCEDESQSGTETDIDCGGDCEPCPVDFGCETELDCETGVCSVGKCVYPADCQELHARIPSAVSGVYTIDPDRVGGVDPFEVSCNMNEEGGGWIELSLQNSDRIVVGQYSATNSWTKCDDDAAKYFTWIDEGTIIADFSPTMEFDEEVSLSYQNPIDGTVYSAIEMAALRKVVTELSASTRMVAVTADDDGVDWDETMSGTGLEVYVRGGSDALYLLTPGMNGDCGMDVTIPGSMSAFYLWTHDPATSATDGNTGVEPVVLPGLASDAILPLSVYLVCNTGGGIAFGWERDVFRVR